jgi:hypothetical protein
MKPAAIFLLYILALVMQQAARPDEVIANREFSLRLGREAIIKNERIRIAFSSVEEDSRCPTGEDCIWAGNAKIAMKISAPNGDPIQVELNTDVEPRHVAFSKYDIKIVGLTPHPKSNSNIDKKAYTARLVLTTRD